MTIIKQLFEIMMLQRRPQDLQYNELAAGYSVVFLIGLMYMLLVQVNTFTAPLAYAAVPQISLVAALYLVLALHKKQTRFVQSCTALFGTSVIFLLSIVAFVSISVLHILIPIWIIWYLYISILIVKEAFGFSWFRAIMIFIVLNIISSLTLLQFYPEFAAEHQAVTQSLTPATSSETTPTTTTPDSGRP